MKPKERKSFCIYNNSIETENDVQVIKELKSGSVKVISIMKYSFLLCLVSIKLYFPQMM